MGGLGTEGRKAPGGLRPDWASPLPRGPRGSESLPPSFLRLSVSLGRGREDTSVRRHDEVGTPKAAPRPRNDCSLPYRLIDYR